MLSSGHFVILLISTIQALIPCMPNRQCYSWNLDLNPLPQELNGLIFTATARNISGSSQYICDNDLQAPKLLTYRGTDCIEENLISTTTIQNNEFVCSNDCTEYTKFRVEIFDDNDASCDNNPFGWMELISSTGCQRINVLSSLKGTGQGYTQLTEGVADDNPLGNNDILFECTETSIGFTTYLQSNINDDKYCDDGGNYDGDYVKMQLAEGCSTAPIYAPFIKAIIVDGSLYKGSPSIDLFRHKLDVEYCGYGTSAEGQNSGSGDGLSVDTKYEAYGLIAAAVFLMISTICIAVLCCNSKGWRAWENSVVDMKEALKSEIEINDTVSMDEHGVHVMEDEPETEKLIVSDSGKEQDMF